MAAVAALAGLALAALAPSAEPPLRPAPWHQLGARVTSRPGKALHFFRTARNPQALAFVVTSSAPRRVRVLWSSYCEVMDDDTGEESNQGTLSGVGQVVGYPPVLAGSTRCYVWINAYPSGNARVAGAEYSY
jgi:hypothetical protein